MKYEATGTIEMNWVIEVEADSEDEAIRRAKFRVSGGDGLDTPVGEPKVDDVELAEKEI